MLNAVHKTPIDCHMELRLLQTTSFIRAWNLYNAALKPPYDLKKKPL